MGVPAESGYDCITILPVCRFPGPVSPMAPDVLSGRVPVEFVDSSFFPPSQETGER